MLQHNQVFKQAQSNLLVSWNCQLEAMTNANGGIGVSLELRITLHQPTVSCHSKQQNFVKGEEEN